MKYSFTPEHLVINDLFGNDITYIIPEYQRPYSWDCLGKSDRNNQVNVMWDDIYEFFLSNRSENYFLGSMVMIGNGNRIYQVIDGQQRLTTIIILLTALKCFVKKLNNDLFEEEKKLELTNFIREVINQIENLIYNKKILGAIPTEKKVKIERNFGYDYDAVLASVMECEQMPNLKTNGLSSEQNTTIHRYFNNRTYFEERFSDNFTTKGIFNEENAIRLNDFLEFLKNKVSVVRILTPTFDVAYHIFEILNNRGLPLSNKDLLRNFIIQEFSLLKQSNPDRYQHIEPAEKWLELDENMPSEFISRWVESTNASQQKYSAFNDLQEIYEKRYKNTLQKSKIEQLHDDLKRDLDYYNLIVNDTIEDKKIRNKIRFLLKAGNERYTINFLLALFRYLDYRGNLDENILTSINGYERFMIGLFLSGSRFSNKPIYDAINYFSVKDNSDFFIQYASKKEILEFLNKSIFRSNVDYESLLEVYIFDNYVAKLFISKYIWYLDYKNDDVVEQVLDFDKATLEHIIPQNPLRNTNWIHDFNEDFRKNQTYKLGNMTLLTQPMNSAAKNYDFYLKQSIYKKTKLSITQEIANLEKITPKIILERHLRIVKGLCEDLEIEYAQKTELLSEKS